MINYFCAHPKILEVINVMGNRYIEIDLEVRSISEFDEILDTTRTKFKEYIAEYTTLIKYEEYSYNYYPIHQLVNKN